MSNTQPADTPPHTALSPIQVAERYNVSRFAVRRWMTTGIATPNGRLRLRATRMGGRWRIALADLDAFFAALTRASLPTDVPVAVNDTPEATRRRAKAARDELRAMGV